MPFKNLFKNIADDKSPVSAPARLFQRGLATFAPLYGAGAWTNRKLHELGLRPRRELPAIVFSVGNVTMGGTGKTPFTIWLARWLRKEGKSPVVLTRGYGRADESRLTIVHDGRRVREQSASIAGDEPLMIAESLGDTPVVACSDRFRAGMHALKRFTLDSFVLDDGLQHVALDRQAEIILIDVTRPLAGLRLFPRGSLREPLGVLSRAHLVVLTRCDNIKAAARMSSMLRRHYPDVPVVRSHVVPARAKGVGETGENDGFEVEWLRGKKVLLVCGVGNPLAVRRTVEFAGAEVMRVRDLGDHARFTRKQIAAWERLRRREGWDAIVVTEKDAVKLRELGAVPSSVVSLGVDLRFITPEDEDRAVKILRARLRARRTRALLH